MVNVKFHDHAARKSYHFMDHFRYDLAALGEYGALYACPLEAMHLAHAICKPYDACAAQSEWTYDLPQGTVTRILRVAAGGSCSSKSFHRLRQFRGGCGHWRPRPGRRRDALLAE